MAEGDTYRVITTVLLEDRNLSGPLPLSVSDTVLSSLGVSTFRPRVSDVSRLFGSNGATLRRETEGSM